MPYLNPTMSSIVSLKDDGKNWGVIQKFGEDGSGRVKVLWANDRNEKWHQLDALKGGFKLGMEVLHEPESSVGKSLGWGIVRRVREIAGVGQVLVEFLESNQRVWLPWQRLRMVHGVQHRFHIGLFERGDSAERQRLRLLAWAIRLWNENTGALATFEIDPLPHQIHLVHHILASGDYNWLIADDVGLGKTIEVGLLLSALRQRGEAKRILLVTPAGLTRQWQEEMDSKFKIDTFRIYGEDIEVNEPRHWKMYDHVIGSMDRFKQADRLDSLLQAEPWDLIIVDEAHRLSRRQYGLKYDSSQRYDMIKALRDRTESLLLLTATPHQGKQDSFVALLELLHPERRDDLLKLSMNPEIIGEMVFRNYKADVTDIEGNFIFHGKTVTKLEVPASESVVQFDQSLKRYLRKGYAAENASGKTTGKAIGFVMTVYRKLAASSVAAIHQALIRRHDRLSGEIEELKEVPEDERFQGEFEEFQISREEAKPFFEGEMEMLEELIKEASQLRNSDAKLNAFMDGLVTSILSNNPKEKILIFSEYRATQEWIRQALFKRFGDDSTVLIHGSMDMNQRRSAIDDFEATGGAQFLVSTEAGGEGINLQHQCHIMVNYDLPWNPMRLVQRVGRLYRYGQKKRVVVFNMHQAQTADEQILGILYDRLDTVATDMATVEAREFNEAMKEDVLGELADLLDIEEILAEADQETVARTRERIDKALKLAKDATEKQHELFSHASGFTLDETTDELEITSEHLQSFVEGMSDFLGVEILERTHKGDVWELRLPESIMKELGVSRQRWAITFDRMLAARRSDLMHMNMDCWLLQFLLQRATEYDFSGVTSLSRGLGGKAQVAAIARWNTLRGRRARQELAVVEIDESGRSTVNSSNVGDWLCQRQVASAGNPPAPDEAKQAFDAAEMAVHERLEQRKSQKLLPDEPQWVAAAWNSE